ncbi:MAG: hypothetical protein JO219_04165 [Candidatus Eremiobacteraeota bacterium]|nr:hypothetical protein [Candidatus Eremiobacteraeota bacterium]MBV8365038.1 hypothetical protein [Candidatus Eremiobacteraeota bacterium]
MKSEEGASELSVHMPPHARLATLSLASAPHALSVGFTDGGERVISKIAIAALSGASIRTEMISPEAEHHSVHTMLIDATMYPLGSARPWRYTGPRLSSEGATLVFGLRTVGPGELLYLVADSFNFRKALGPLAGYSTEMNLRELIRQVAALAPDAERDDFVNAVIGRVPLPPPYASLVEYFKAAARPL